MDVNTIQRQKEHFSRIARIFDTRFNVYRNIAGKVRVEKRIDFFIESCDLNKDKRILELGCGTGEYTVKFCDFGIRPYALDFSVNMLSLAENKSKQLYFIAGDIHRLPFKSKVFDCVVGNAILHHLELKPALKEIARVLKKGGRVAFTEPNMFNPQIFLQKNIGFIRYLSGDVPGEIAFFRWALKRIFKEEGFHIEYIAPRDFLHPLTPDSLVSICEKLSRFFEKISFLKEFSGSIFVTARLGESR